MDKWREDLFHFGTRTKNSTAEVGEVAGRASVQAGVVVEVVEVKFKANVRVCELEKASRANQSKPSYIPLTF